MSSFILRQRGLELYVINTATNGPYPSNGQIEHLPVLEPLSWTSDPLRGTARTTVVSPCSHVRRRFGAQN